MTSLFELRRENVHTSPSRILHEILRDPYSRDYTYVILGKTGPTGKTWLWDKLKTNGFDTFELSETIYKLVDYTDNDNHVLVDRFHKVIVIVLNRSLR